MTTVSDIRTDRGGADQEHPGEEPQSAVCRATAPDHLHRYLYAERLVAGRVMLDAVCCDGSGSYILARRPASVIGVAAGASKAQNAERRYRSASLLFAIGSIDRPSVEGASIDVAIHFEPLLPAVQSRDARAELRRVLKPKGLPLLLIPGQAGQDTTGPGRGVVHADEPASPAAVSLPQRQFLTIRLLAQNTVHSSLIRPVTSPRDWTGDEENAAIETVIACVDDLEAPCVIPVAGSMDAPDPGPASTTTAILAPGSEGPHTLASRTRFI